jgi:oligogalacturonide lyase
VLFDSARYDGSSNLYLAAVPAFEELPEYESD